MGDETPAVARRVATRLAARLDPELPAKVEQALAQDPLERSPERVIDPISLAVLIVSVVGLGWTIYHDIKKDREDASADRGALSERVAGRLRERDPDELLVLTAEDRNLVIDMVAQEVVAADDLH